MTAPGTDGETGNGDLAAQWSFLCERFHEIRLGSHRHNLVDTWRRLKTTNPDDPDALSGWQELDERIRQLDERESRDAVRYGTGGGEAASDDWDRWDDLGDEFGCPVGRCDRKARAFLGAVPRCELFGCEMIPITAQPGR